MVEYPGYLIRQQLPEKEAVIRFTTHLSAYLFPVSVHPESFLDSQEMTQLSLRNELRSLLQSLDGTVNARCEDITAIFFRQLPALTRELLDDAALISSFDPAAHSVDEVILTYPGFFAIRVHRIAHILYREQVPFIPRIMAEWAHSITGIDIHPGASIGSPFCIDHGTGIVVGETSVIGRFVKMYQGVTLGALAVRKEDASNKRHPTIGDNVVLYAGCTILGGDTVIGHDSIIGGNTWITSSINPFSVVYHKEQTVIGDRRRTDMPAIDFVI